MLRNGKKVSNKKGASLDRSIQSTAEAGGKTNKDTHWTMVGAMPMAAKARSAAASWSSRDAIVERERERERERESRK